MCVRERERERERGTEREREREMERERENEKLSSNAVAAHKASEASHQQVTSLAL